MLCCRALLIARRSITMRLTSFDNCPMDPGFAHGNSYTVRLSVDGYSYTAELWRASDTDWTLLSVQVENFDAETLNVRRSTCLDALLAAEKHSRSVIEAINPHVD